MRVAVWGVVFVFADPSFPGTGCSACRLPEDLGHNCPEVAQRGRHQRTTDRFIIFQILFHIASRNGTDTVTSVSKENLSQFVSETASAQPSFKTHCETNHSPLASTVFARISQSKCFFGRFPAMRSLTTTRLFCSICRSVIVVFFGLFGKE